MNRCESGARLFDRVRPGLAFGADSLGAARPGATSQRRVPRLDNLSLQDNLPEIETKLKEIDMA